MYDREAAFAAHPTAADGQYADIVETSRLVEEDPATVNGSRVGDFIGVEKVKDGTAPHVFDSPA